MAQHRVLPQWSVSACPPPPHDPVSHEYGCSQGEVGDDSALTHQLPEKETATRSPTQEGPLTLLAELMQCAFACPRSLVVWGRTDQMQA